MSHRFYRINLDNGLFIVSLPETVSKFDVEQIKANFAIIVRQCERRATEDKINVTAN